MYVVLILLVDKKQEKNNCELFKTLLTEMLTWMFLNCLSQKNSQGVKNPNCFKGELPLQSVFSKIIFLI